MLSRVWIALGAALVLVPGTAAAQNVSKDPVTDGRPLSAWIKDLKATAPQVRNAAAYEISGLGPAAAPAVPALIEALDDPEASVRYPVTVALREIGPAAAAAVPRLRKMEEEDVNDELAAAARRARLRIQPDSVSQDSTSGE